MNAPRSYPQQVQLWTVLLSVQIAKHWAIDLDTTEVEVSRWVNGRVAMGLDALTAAIRVCRRLGREDVGLRVATLLIEAADPSALPLVERDPLEVGLRASEVAGRAATTVMQVYADRHIDLKDAAALDRCANELEEAAKGFRDVAAAARLRTDA